MGKILDRMKELAALPPAPATKPPQDDDLTAFTRCVLAAMGLPITQGGKRQAEARGTDFEKLYNGTPVYLNRPAYDWREITNVPGRLK